MLIGILVFSVITFFMVLGMNQSTDNRLTAIEEKLDEIDSHFPEHDLANHEE